MGAKVRKALKKTVKKAYSQFPHFDSKTASADFLPLKAIFRASFQEPNLNKTMLLSCILVAFHMAFMRKKWKTGKSKHFGFIEFENPQVAEVVVDYMHNYPL